jgi:hypothetical protein
MNDYILSFKHLSADYDGDRSDIVDGEVEERTEFFCTATGVFIGGFLDFWADKLEDSSHDVSGPCAMSDDMRKDSVVRVCTYHSVTLKPTFGLSIEGVAGNGEW